MKITVRDYAQLRGIRLNAVYQSIWSGRLNAAKEDGKWFIIVHPTFCSPIVAYNQTQCAMASQS